LLVIAAEVAAQSSSSARVIIDGRALDVATGEPLAGARVLVNDGPVESSTDRDGTFRLIAPSSGSLTLKITYLGQLDWTRALTVEPGAIVHLGDIAVGAIEENVVVVGTLMRDASARALNQQKSAPNITNVVSADQIGSFPDRNAAETTQRVAGVSITKDQGEGRYVSVRGTEARLNAMMIDGQRIPSPDPLLRQVAVDVVPSELLQAIEVSRALTPDVDGDSPEPSRTRRIRAGGHCRLPQPSWVVSRLRWLRCRRRSSSDTGEHRDIAPNTLSRAIGSLLKWARTTSNPISCRPKTACSSHVTRTRSAARPMRK
jgi:hypothetical protein